MNIIKEILREKEITMTALGHATGMSKAHISNIVNRKILPRTKTITAIANVLDINADYCSLILGRTPERIINISEENFLARVDK